MRGDVIEIRTRSEILLVGEAGALFGLPAPRRHRSVSALNRMTLGERLDEVLRRTAGRPPRAMGEELLSLVTSESIAIALGLAAFGAAAEFTPVGWAADLIIAAIAF